MRSFKKKMLILLFGVNIIFAPGISGAQQKTFGEELTEIFQEVWPYKAFLAIPKINEIAPRLIIPIDSFGKVKRCICICRNICCESFWIFQYGGSLFCYSGQS